MSFAPSALEDLGWNASLAEKFAALPSAQTLVPARVTEEMKGFYRVRSAGAEFLAEIAGKIRHQAGSREDIPAVGDWVAITARPGESRARIDSILPRKTKQIGRASCRERV